MPDWSSHFRGGSSQRFGPRTGLNRSSRRIYSRGRRRASLARFRLVALCLVLIGAAAAQQTPAGNRVYAWLASTVEARIAPAAPLAGGEAPQAVKTQAGPQPAPAEVAPRPAPANQAEVAPPAGSAEEAGR